MGPEWFFFQLTSTHISIPHSIPFHSHYQLVEIHQLFLLLLFHLFGLHSHCKSVRIMLAWRLDCLNGCNEGRCLYFTSTNYDRQSLPPTGQVWLSKSSFPLTTTFLFIGYEKKPFPFTIWPPRKKKPNCKYVKYCTRVWLCTHFVFLLFLTTILWSALDIVEEGTCKQCQVSAIMCSLASLMPGIWGNSSLRSGLLDRRKKSIWPCQFLNQPCLWWRRYSIPNQSIMSRLPFLCFQMSMCIFRKISSKLNMTIKTVKDVLRNKTFF